MRGEWLLGAAGNAAAAEGRRKTLPRRLMEYAAQRARQDGAIAIMKGRRQYAARSAGASRERDSLDGRALPVGRLVSKKSTM